MPAVRPPGRTLNIRYPPQILCEHAEHLCEIWAYGLRNPYRFSFDRQTHDMLIGDVGGGTTEEVDFQASASSTGSGYNYGWPTCEGLHPQGQTSGACNFGIAPILSYFHGPVRSRAMRAIGGYRYRGPYQRLQGYHLSAISTVGRWSARSAAGAGC